MHRSYFLSALSSDANLQVCGQSLHVCWYMHYVRVFVDVPNCVRVLTYVCVLEFVKERK